MAHDYEALTWDETAAIGELLPQLASDEFDHASLCDGWRVRDVIGHMEYGHLTGMGTIVKKLIGYRFNLTKGSFEMSRQWATEHTPDELVEIWSTELVGDHARRGISKTIKWHEAFLDHFIHHQDIRRPLDRPRPIPEASAVAALDAVLRVSTPLFSTKKQVGGLRLEATDVPFVHGEGPLVKGPAEAIVMVAAGRTVAMDELDGDGVALLSDRVAQAA